MIKSISNFFGKNPTIYLKAKKSYKNCFSRIHNSADKGNAIWLQTIKWEELQNKALSLIYNRERTYVHFSEEEKNIVDFFQEKIWEEAEITLPNTKASLELAKAAKMSI